MNELLYTGEFYSFITGKTYIAISRRLQRNLKEAGIDITVEQWSILFSLWQKDGQTQQELGQRTFKDKTSITRLIDNLEKQNSVVRIPDKNDKRINLIYLTQKGRALQDTTLPLAEKTLNEALNHVSEEKMAVCREVLQQVFDNLQ